MRKVLLDAENDVLYQNVTAEAQSFGATSL